MKRIIFFHKNLKTGSDATKSNLNRKGQNLDGRSEQRHRKKDVWETRFLVNDKLCVCANENELMCRIDPDLEPEILDKKGCRSVEMRGRARKVMFMLIEMCFKWSRT